MKKLLIIGAILIVIVSVVSIFIANMKVTVSFSLSEGNYTVTVRDKKGGEVAKLEKSTSIELKKGEYYYAVEGEGYDGRSTSFKVDGERTIKIAPIYLEKYRAATEADERAAIAKLIADTYPSVKNVSIQSFSINETGEWGYGKLIVSSNTADIYRFVTKRKAGKWVFAAKPSIALYTRDYKDIPEEIIYSLY